LYVSSGVGLIVPRGLPKPTAPAVSPRATCQRCYYSPDVCGSTHLRRLLTPSSSPDA